MNTYKVVVTMELESFVDADNEQEALEEVMAFHHAMNDGPLTVVDQHVTLWRTEDDEDDLN